MPGRAVEELERSLSSERRSLLLSTFRDLAIGGKGRVLAKALVAASRRDLSGRAALRLRQVLHRTATWVPYYRKHFHFDGQGALPALDETPSLSDFPVVTKRLRRTLPMDEFIARDPSTGPKCLIDVGPLYITRTNGSTGIPTAHISSARSDDFWEHVTRIRMHRDLGLPPMGEMYTAGLYRSPKPGGTGLYSCPLRPLTLTLFSGPYLRWNFTEFHVGASDAELPFEERFRLSRAMLKASGNPQRITGAPSRLVQLARLVEASGIPKRPKYVTSTSEPLAEADRRMLETSFGCSVRSVYSLSEFGTVAWECPARGLHYEPDMSIIEVLDADGRSVQPGQPGRLVLTSLRSLVMPNIRADTGDVAVLSAGRCACGSGLPWLKSIEGRQSVSFYSATGRRYDSHMVLRVFDQCEFGEFQVVQDKPGQLRAIVRQGSNPSGDLSQRAEVLLEELFKERFRIEVEPSGAFILTPGGKRNPAVQRIEPDTAALPARAG